MNGYIYWYYANAYLFSLLIGWMARGKGMAVYLLLSFSPLYALYALPVMVAERYFGMTAVHLFLFYPGSKQYAKWENEYKRTCTDWKNLLVTLFSLCCMTAAGVLLFGNNA